MDKTKMIIMNVERLAKWMHVSSVQYLGPVRFKRLYSVLGENIDDIFKMKEDDLLKMKGIISAQVIKGIELIRNQKSKYQKLAAEQLNKRDKTGGHIILLADDNYPNFLYNSSMSHPIIYCVGKVGKFKDFKESIAIVGSRNASAKSLKVAENVAKELATNGWVIISGMAKGIDAAAHTGAIAASGKSIAVLGGGPDIVYPAENKNIYTALKNNNLVISEYPFGSRPQALQLKKRNKTIVALAKYVFIVQSKIDGGAMNAYTGSKEQKKPVFTLKGTGTPFSGNAKIISEGGISLSPDDKPNKIMRLVSN